jgi:hypothetical protein
MFLAQPITFILGSKISLIRRAQRHPSVCGHSLVSYFRIGPKADADSTRGRVGGDSRFVPILLQKVIVGSS